MLNRFNERLGYTEISLMEHRGIDGHLYVLRSLPRMEARSQDHERQLGSLSQRVSRIEQNRYTDMDGRRFESVTESRISLLLERIKRLEQQSPRHP